MFVLERVASRRTTPYVVAVALYAAVGVVIGAGPIYLPVYYDSLGMPLGAIGLLAGVAALSGWLAAPAWGMVADQLTGVRLVLVAAALGAAASATGMALAAELAVVALMAILFALSFAGIGPVLDAYALEQVAADRHRYARLRVWSSIAFVVASVVVGALIGQLGVHGLFAVLVPALLATAIFAFGVPPRAVRIPGLRRGGVRAALRRRPLTLFLVAATVAWSAATMVNGFLSIYLISLNAPTVLVGGAWAVGAAVEVPVMIAFPALAGRFGVRALTVAGAVFLLLRVIVLLLTSDPLIVALSMTLHGAGFALLLVGGVTHVAGLAPRGSEATAQGLLSGIVFGLAQALGPGMAGLIAGAVGIPTMFIVAAAASAVGVVAVAGVLRGYRPATAA